MHIKRKVMSQCVSVDYCKGWNDAVDTIVRCKNCIFRDIAGVPPFMYYYCRNVKGLSDVIKDDDYCSCGVTEIN